MNLQNKIKRKTAAAELALLSLILFLITKSNLWLFLAIVLLVIGSYIDDLISPILVLQELIFVKLIGAVVSKIVLFIIFYFLLTPLALIRRLFGSNILLVKRPAGMISYWKDRYKKFSKDELERQF